MAQSDDSPSDSLSRTLRTKLEKAGGELKNKDQELGELKKQLWEKEDKLREKTEELNTELRENNRLKEELREIKSELTERKKELEEKEEEIESVREANVSLKNECSEYSSLKEKYTKVLLQNKSLNNENEIQASHNYKLKEELERLKMETESQDQLDSSVSRPDKLRISSTNTEDTMSPTSGQVMMRRISSSSSGHSTFVATPTEFNLKSLMNLLGKAADSWMQIGIQLDISPSKLKSIKKDNSECIDCLSETLDTWLNNASDDTLNYDTIYIMLRSSPVDRKDLIPSDFR